MAAEEGLAAALESLRLGQLDNVEACTSAVDGDFQDLLDTTDLPSKEAWKTLSEALQQWRSSTKAAQFWGLVSEYHHQQQRNSGGSVEVPGHRALLALLHLTLKSKGGVDLWMLATMYVWMMDLPGASAYGVFNANMFRCVLALLKSWLHGGKANESSSQSQKQSQAKRGKRGPASGNLREDSEDDAEDGDEGDDSDGGSVRRRKPSVRAGSRKKTATASDTQGVELLLNALEDSLTKGSLQSSLQAHDDMQGELAELVLAIYAKAPAKGGLREAAHGVVMTLLMIGPHAVAGNPLVLRALMPMLTMKPGRSGIPTDARSRTAAHQKALQVLLAMVAEGEEQKTRLGEDTTDRNEHRKVREGSADDGKGADEEGEVSDHEGGDDMEDKEEDTAMNVDGHEEAAEDSVADEDGADEDEPEEDSEDDDDADDVPGGAARKTAAKKSNSMKGCKKSKAQKTNVSSADAPRPSLHVTTLSVLQHMCSDASDRADVRARVVDSVLTVLEALKKAAPELDSRFVTFLSKLMRSSKVSSRASGVELAASFLMMPWAWPTTDDHDNAPLQGSEDGSSAVGPSSIMSMVALMGSFASRVLDKAPTVRSRAMVCLSEMLNSVHEGAAPPRLTEALLALAFPSKSVPEGQDLVSLVRSRVQDDKAVVRKAALQALEILLTTRTSGESLTKEDVSLFSTRCNDVSVLTRKQAISSLSSLLLSDAANRSLQETWVRAVLPLVADPEQSILNRLAELFNDVVIDRVLAWHQACSGHALFSSSTSRGRRAAPALSSQQPEETDRSVWQLLSIVASRDLNKCLGQAVSMVMQGAAQDKAHIAARRVKDLMEALRAAALASLDSSTDAMDAISLRRGAWALLEALLVKDSGSPGGSVAGAAGAATASAACPGGGGVMVPSDPGFVVACWRQALEGLGELMEQAAAGEEGSAEAQALACALEDDARKILRVLSRIAQDVPGEMAMELADELLGSLAELDPRLSPENCGAALETIAALCLTKAESPEQGVEILQNAADEILRSVEVVLKAFVVDREHNNDLELIPRLERATFLVGAVAILGFNANEEEIKPSSAAAEKRKAAKKGAAASGAPPTIRIPVPAPTVSLLSVLLAPKLLPVTHQDESGQQQTKEAVAVVPEQVRAHAFLALGKACLRSKALAKDNMNLFVRELSVGSSPAIKSNALLILGDLCVRYTSLVERHVPAMARCLQDENPLIRRHALSLMSQLLLQDYLKWRGLLLYRYLAMLVDVNHRVSDVANYMIFGPLLRKSPSLLVTHFVEAMVVLNGCEDHENYKAALSQGAETGSAVTMEGVDLEGDGVMAKRRMHVYKAMLQHMTDEQRIQVAAKLTQSILGAVTDDDGERGGIKIMSHHRAARHGQQKREALLRKLKRNENLIRDAVAILRCPDIKVSGGGKSGAAAADEDAESLMANDDGTSGADAAAAAKKKLLSKVSSKHLLEHVVPTVVSLKGCLERAHSPLLRDVMEYLADMMRANKDEVKDALSADPTLFHELEYDLAQYEKEIKAKAEPRHVTMPVASTDAATAAQSMPPPPPRSPAAGLLNSRRRSSMATAAMQTAARRRSSVGIHRAAATPGMTGCSAPRLRRSSIGAPLSRTPAEAMKSALTGGGPGQVLTATPMNVDRDNDGVRRETVNLKMPDTMKQWQVDVAGSPLDEPPRSKENKPQQQTTCG